MAPRSSRPLARALLSPLGAAALVVGAAGGWLAAGAPGAVLGALLLLGLRVGLGLSGARTPRPGRIDPFAVGEPWRHYVQDALQAQRRFHQAVQRAQRGPLLDRLREIEARVDTGVQEVWEVATRGHALLKARNTVKPDVIRREMAALEARSLLSTEPSTLEHTREALQAQLDAAERLERVILDADSRLQLITARLDEAATRTVELAVGTGDDVVLAGLGDQIDGMVLEMEALRQAIEETGGGGSAVAGPG